VPPAGRSCAQPPGSFVTAHLPYETSIQFARFRDLTGLSFTFFRFDFEPPDFFAFAFDVMVILLRSDCPQRAVTYS